MKIINWVKLFKSKDAQESLLSLADNKPEIDKMRTLELTIQKNNFFVIPDVYMKENGKIRLASKEDIDTLMGDTFDSYLNDSDKALFREFIKKVFDFEDLVEFKK